MKVFLAGVSCVGKSAIGASLAVRLGYPFYDLDTEIERHFAKPMARLWSEVFTPYAFRKQFSSVVLKKVLAAEPNVVVALPPSGLMDCMWRILKNVERVVVALRDSPQNILARSTFYDADSRPLVKTLSDEERPYHLKEIKKDIAYFGRSFPRADLTVDLDGLDVESSATKIEGLLRQSAGRLAPEMPAMCLAQAVTEIREVLTALQTPTTPGVWSTIVKQIKRSDSFDARHADTIQEVIRGFLGRLDDATVVSLWRETETGMADDSKDSELVSEWVRMALEMELLQAVTELAGQEARPSR